MTKTVDQWAAEQCGVEIFPFPTDKIVFYHLYWSFKDTNYEYPWTIQDPRCREIVREHFKLSTIYRYWVMPTEMVYETTTRNCIKYEGKTIAEAEIACITAIYEASQ